MRPQFDVIIVGGGLAGLTTAIVLAKANKKVLLLEKKIYPYHKVCGEYISNEVLDYLQFLGFDPFHFGASNITNLRISTPRGKNIHVPLDLGGFGISRYTMDEALCELAINSGARVETATRVTDIQFEGEQFSVTTSHGDIFTSRLAIGSYGKREMLDKKLGRHFMKAHTGYMAVKYHILTDYPRQEIGLDNFKGGYCGISKIEGDRYNLCYLYKRPVLKAQRSIKELESEVLFQNPMLKQIFTGSEFLFKTPEVINEIYFEPKSQVENHILMCGDTAGLITPLCGNGMSMAISGAQLLTKLILETNILSRQNDTADIREQLENTYKVAWNQRFSKRLFCGRALQHFFGNPLFTKMSLGLLHAFPPFERKIISLTHGNPLLPDAST